MKTVLFVSFVVCVLQLTLAGPLQQQVPVDPSEEFEQVTEPKLEYLPIEKDDAAMSIRIDDGGLFPEVNDQDENEQEVQQVQQQVFEDDQVVTTPDDESDEDVHQSTERAGEDQSEESWFCSVFGCIKP
uniref:Putative conserved secreted protein n=1 Tax=Culex tarsalis TaxID=7177 RepID=A0A1Q3FMX5_CULTA